MDFKMKSIQLRLYEARAGIGNQIDEELTHEQKKEVDTYGDGSAATKISSHVFPEGQDRITVPLSHQDVPPHPDVKDHLEKHGYKITNYMAGKAEDQHGREINIGKALTKTKAHPDVMHSFVKDPNRQSTKSKIPLKVIISKHPHDVAGMSTDRHWASCMTMGGKSHTSGKEEESGVYSHHLRDDVEHGTHVAYLVHHDDDDIKRPVARIALKPHHGITSGHTILKPEETEYGNSNHAFKKTVKDFAEKHYPMKDIQYQKNSNLYDDDGTNTIHNPNATSKDIHKGLDSEDSNTREAAISHPNATSEHIHKALGDSNPRIRSFAIHHENVNKEHIDKALNDSDEDVRASAARNHKATSEQIHKGLNDESSHVRMFAIRNRNATTEHIDKALNDPSVEVRHSAILNKKATSKHIDKALDDKSISVRSASLRHDNVSSEHIHKALDDKDRVIRRSAILHQNATPKNIHKALDDNDASVRNSAIQHRKATSENIHKALDDKDHEVRYSAMRHDNVTSENIHKALDDSGEKVRMTAAGRWNATPENINKALNDKSGNVRHTAVHSRNASLENLEKASNDKDSAIRSVAKQKLKLHALMKSSLPEEYVPTKKQYNKISLNKFRMKFK